jgi:ribosomal protein S18 acetylase RimI-like enzyme
VSGWRVELDVDDETAAAALGGDRAWGGYSLADLEPPFRAYTRVAVAAGTGGQAALTDFRHPAFTSIISHGHPDGLAAILARAELPGETFVLARPEHVEPLSARYDVADLHPMVRMAVDRKTFQPPDPLPAADRLGAPDCRALLDLYASYPESAFTPDMLDLGVFYGVREDGRLLAAAGTHVVGRRGGIAAVGNIYVRPEARGLGLGRAVTARTAAELLDGPCRDVILNVAVDNEPAQRLYRRLGFREHCRYLEGMATSRASP